MFMGTERVPADSFDRLMEAHGGANNASTGNDRTCYESFGPKELLPTLLWLEADRMQSLGWQPSTSVSSTCNATWCATNGARATR